MASEAKKAKVESPEWFTFKKFPTDVTLKFDDGKALYVSKEFLIYSSPVFEAMLTHEMKEKQEGTVELKGKSYTDFLNMLLSMHPATTKRIDESTVLSVLEIAHEYQMPALVTRCKEEITKWMNGTSKKGIHEESKVNVYLKIIKTASDCMLEDILTEAIEHISKFKMNEINGTFKFTSTWSNDYRIKVQAENETMFESLDIAVANKIYIRRLQIIDK